MSYKFGIGPRLGTSAGGGSRLWERLKQRAKSCRARGERNDNTGGVTCQGELPDPSSLTNRWQQRPIPAPLARLATKLRLPPEPGCTQRESAPGDKAKAGLRLGRDMSEIRQCGFPEFTEPGGFGPLTAQHQRSSRDTGLQLSRVPHPPPSRREARWACWAIPAVPSLLRPEAGGGADRP
jgi:hypothetical protein